MEHADAAGWADRKGQIWVTSYHRMHAARVERAFQQAFEKTVSAYSFDECSDLGQSPDVSRLGMITIA